MATKMDMECAVNACEGKAKKVMAAMFQSGSDKICYGPLKGTMAQHMSM